MEEITLDTSKMQWEALRRFPGAADVKELREEPRRGAMTMLVRLPAGGHLAPHTHAGVVQHYVLEGEYESQGQTFAAGRYRLLPEHTDVPPISSEGGVTLLIIYDPVTT
jgi:anti-sigma factor ChrR (cupin superfamily)